MAYWAKMSDEELVNRSSVIVYGEYLGESEIKLPSQKMPINLGIISAFQLLKGKKAAKFFFVNRPPQNAPMRSDILYFKAGQSGLWFLKGLAESAGIYEITHPSQFLPLKEGSSELNNWKKRIR